MKVDFGTVLTSLAGEPLTIEDGKPWTAGAMAAETLLAPQSPHDASPRSVVQIAERHELAMRIFKGGSVEITTTEATLIQESAAKYCLYPIAAAQIIELTNGK